MTVGLRKRSTSSTAKEKKKKKGLRKRKLGEAQTGEKTIPILKKLFYLAIILKI